jgi:opacity protein-like surface antigen
MHAAPRHLLATLALAAAGAAQAANIDVLTAWYGQSCGAQHGNVTSHIKASCDGREACDYRVSADTLGDPKRGCGKNYLVLYMCTGDPVARLVQLPAEADGRSVGLSCRR